MSDEILLNTKKIIAGTGISVLTVVGGVTGDYYLNPRVDLIAEKVTPYEYDQIKPELVEKVDKKEVIKHKEKQMWAGVARKEAKKCKEIKFNDFNNLNGAEKINDFIKSGDCEAEY